MENSVLRQVQLTQLSIAKEIKRICEKYNINYFLDGGTLLGAVRHKGFIPWDDDLDVGMIRSEYDKFLKIAPTELKSDFFLQTWDTDLQYPNAYAKIRKKGTALVEAAYEYSNMHKEIWVDIFPYDVYPDDKKNRKYQGKKIMFFRSTMWMKNNVKPWLNHKSFITRQLVKVKYTNNVIYSHFHNKKEIKAKYDKVMRLYNDNNTQYYFEESGGTPYGKWIVPKSCLDNLTSLQFEDTAFSVPSNYDKVLTILYGNYMQLPPIEKRVGHNVIEVKV